MNHQIHHDADIETSSGKPGCANGFDEFDVDAQFLETSKRYFDLRRLARPFDALQGDEAASPSHS